MMGLRIASLMQKELKNYHLKDFLVYLFDKCEINTNIYIMIYIRCYACYFDSEE